MPHNSYIKDLVSFPPGTDSTYVGITETIASKNLTNYVSLTSDTIVDDGTGINDLVKYRLQFENPTYDINAPIKIDWLNNFFVNKLYNHTCTTTKPFSWQKFKGAAALYTSLIFGKPESPPKKDRNGWNTFKRFFRCRMQRAFGMSEDKNLCYNWTYFRDAAVTLKVAGGYGDPSHLVVSLKTAAGALIGTQRPDANGIVSFTGLAGSANGDRNAPGWYRVEVGDISLKYKHATSLFVAYAPKSTPFTHTYKGIKQTFANNTTLTPGVNNALWAVSSRTSAPPTAIPPTLDVMRAEQNEDPDLSDCSTDRVDFFAAFDEYSGGNITWQFAYKVNGSSSWTSIGSPQTILGSSLLTNVVPVSAAADIPLTQTGGLWRLQATYAGGTVFFDKEQDGSPATFTLTEPAVDNTWDDLTETSTPIVRIPATVNRNYNVTINYTASSCKAFQLEVLRWDGDRSGSITDNMPLSAPLAGFTIVNSKLHAAGITHTTAIVDRILDKTPGTEFTYAIRFKNTAAPFNITVYPPFLKTPETTDPDTGDIDPAADYYRVITLT